jgi:hypothetical protein
MLWTHRAEGFATPTLNAFLAFFARTFKNTIPPGQALAYYLPQLFRLCPYTRLFTSSSQSIKYTVMDVHLRRLRYRRAPPAELHTIDSTCHTKSGVVTLDRAEV